MRLILKPAFVLRSGVAASSARRRRARAKKMLAQSLARYAATILPPALLAPCNPTTLAQALQHCPLRLEVALKLGELGRPRAENFAPHYLRPAEALREFPDRPVQRVVTWNLITHDYLHPLTPRDNLYDLGFESYPVATAGSIVTARLPAW